MKADRASLLGSLLFAVFVLGGVSGCGDDVETPVSPGDPVWARRFGRASAPEATAIAGFPTGGVVVAGRYYGDLSFGGSVLPSPSNNYQMILARYDAEGNHIYSKSFGQEAAEWASDVAVFADGSALVVGDFSWKVDFGTGELLSEGGNDIFLMKVDPAGKPIWVKQLGGPGGQEAKSITVFPDGSAAISGLTSGPVDFLEGEPVSSDVLGFVLRLDKNGDPLWGKAFSDLSYQPVVDVAARPDGGVVIGGIFYNSVNLGGPTSLVANQSQDGFVAAYDAQGKWLWNKAIGGEGYSDAVSAFAVRPNGNVLLTGEVEGQVDLGGGLLGGATGDANTFLLELDSQGKHVDSKIFGLSGWDAGNDVSLAADGSVVLTGLVNGNISFGLGLLSTAGGLDAFVAKIGPSGQPRFQVLFGGEGTETGNRVAVDGLGNVITSGSVEGAVDFGLGLTTGSGYAETFLVSLSP